MVLACGVLAPALSYPADALASAPATILIHAEVGQWAFGAAAGAEVQLPFERCGEECHHDVLGALVHALYNGGCMPATAAPSVVCGAVDVATRWLRSRPSAAAGTMWEVVQVCCLLVHAFVVVEFFIA